MTPSRGGLLAKTDKGHYTVYNRAAKLPEGGFVKSFAGGYNVAKGVGRMLRQAGGVEYELTYKKVKSLNRRLAAAPAAAVEYVILHEYLHLIYPDHGPAFHAALDAMMPDNRARRALLRGGADWKNPDSVVE